MWFWWFMLCCDILIPVLMIALGRRMWKHPPKAINDVIGYRTSRSMMNRDTWEFAHHYSGKLWWKAGWIALLPSVAIHIPFYGASDGAVAIVGGVLATLQIVVLAGCVFQTEKVLKEAFTEEGARRDKGSSLEG
ncbi:hypothetical protein CE91St44_24950 [Oscillospiraceae bacterium]|nr:hypothetical protein CE91St44_24950 [Oscillospiraceae bacterium]